jgi:hypothetical protein
MSNPSAHVLESKDSPVPIRIGAERLGLTPAGLLKILRRTNSALRDDGRWFAATTTIDQIENARRVLGLDKDARLQPFLDKADHVRVIDPVL